MSAADAQPVSSAEAVWLFRALEHKAACILAVSGGPDSTALLVLAAQWRRDRNAATRLVALTVDHGLRPEAAAEAAVVGQLAASLGVEHRTLRWAGAKPETRLQEAARNARYGLLLSAASEFNADRILTGHTLDDQAETVLMRLCRGSGISGLRGMDRVAPLPVPGRHRVQLVRPFLTVPKARLIATLTARGIGYADDPSNANPHFTRVRLRRLMQTLAAEGMSARRLADLAARAARVDDAMVHATEAGLASVVGPSLWPEAGPLTISGAAFRALPDEIGLRVLERVIGFAGDEGPVELAKLEALHAALLAPLDAALGIGGGGPFRRTLAGAVVTLTGSNLVIERAPPRRQRTGKPAGRRIPALTTRRTRPFDEAGTR